MSDGYVDGDVPPAVDLVVVCTGNVARSVMAGAMCQWLADAQGLALRVTTAGTLVAEGQPMSMRTHAALATIPEVADALGARHRSHQLTPRDVAAADLVVAMEADHVRYVRRHHPQAAASRTATLRRLCRDLEPGPPSLRVRLDALGLAGVDPGTHEDVLDPAGGDSETYVACAAELWVLCQELVARL